MILYSDDQNGEPQYRLTVCGGIRTKRVVVEAGWCDFAFDPLYKYMNPIEKEKYYKVFHHPPLFGFTG